MAPLRLLTIKQRTRKKQQVHRGRLRLLGPEDEVRGPRPDDRRRRRVREHPVTISVRKDRRVRPPLGSGRILGVGPVSGSAAFGR